MIGEGLGEIFQFEAEPLRFHNNRLDLTFEQAGFLAPGGLRACGYDGAQAGADFEKAIGNKTGDNFVGGIGIDLELPAESADGGEGIARTELAGHHGLGGSVNDLLIELAAGMELDVERNHACTIAGSTALSRWFNGIRWKGEDGKWKVGNCEMHSGSFNQKLV